MIRGDVEERCFSVFYLKDGVARSVFALNRGKDVSVGQRMVMDGFRPDLELLRDPDQNLRGMVRPSPKPSA